MQNTISSFNLFNTIKTVKNNPCSFYKLLLMSTFMTTYPINAIEIVSIGSACKIASATRHNNLRTTAYPFDWMITSMSALTALFTDDFSNMFIPEQMHESEAGNSVIDKYGLIFIHDFPTIYRPIAPNDDEISEVHRLHPNWRD